MKPAVANSERFLLFLENLEAHRQENFNDGLKEFGGTTWFGVANATDIWQPVDGGYGATRKALINREFFDWLDDDDNLEKWYGENNH